MICAVTIGIRAGNAIPAIAIDEQIYTKIIENELPAAEENQITFREIASSILGFDITQPSSILQSHSSVFTTPKPTASPEATVQPFISDTTENKIEEVNISKGLSVNNKTSYEIDTNALSAQTLHLSPENDGPQVLIVHTHTTESYTSAGNQTYAASDSDRSTDSSRNIVAVGDAICDTLNQNGIHTIHDTTVHDYPSYNGAYNRCLTTIKNNLNQYPSIRVILDVHRDGMVRADGTKLKVVTELNQVKTAQVMLVVGTNASGLLHDNWQQNLSFACKIQKEANQLFPTLMRPIDLREERFNQHLTTGSLILEVGSNGNTLEEAIQGGKAAASAIANVLKNNP